MSRFINLRILLGIILIVAAPLTILVFARASLPQSIPVVVASVDLKPGDLVAQTSFHREDWMNADPKTIDSIITVDQFGAINGARIAPGQEVKAGHAISLSQVVFDKTLNDAVNRLTVLAAPGKVVFPVELPPGQASNWMQSGDFVDFIFTVGSVQPNTLDVPISQSARSGSLSDPLATPIPLPSGGTLTPIIVAPTPGSVNQGRQLLLPVASVPLMNVRVLRVERERKQQTTTNSTTGESTTSYVAGDVKRLYVELSPSDTPVVGFLLANGKVFVASHLNPIDPASNPYPGLTWTDFSNWFTANRTDLYVTPVPKR